MMAYGWVVIHQALHGTMHSTFRPTRRESIDAFMDVTRYIEPKLNWRQWRRHGWSCRRVGVIAMDDGRVECREAGGKIVTAFPETPESVSHETQ